MILERLLQMVDEELEDFQNEREKRKGLKSLVDFTSTSTQYDGNALGFEIKPKFKQKVKSSVYIKEDKNKRPLF